MGHQSQFIRYFIQTLSGASLLFAAQLTVSAAPMSGDVPLEIEQPAYQTPWKRYGNWPQEDWSQFNTLDKPRTSIQAPPVGKMQPVPNPIVGDAENGKKLVADRSRGGSCYACHAMPGASLPGNVGPEFFNVGSWGRSDEHLYNYIYDPRAFNPGTVMPPWGAHGVFTQQEIFDIVTYLKTLTGKGGYPDSMENPFTRPEPVEDRDNLDLFENPGMLGQELGEQLYSVAGPNGQSCASCHEKPAQLFKTWATSMPRFEARLNKMLGIEEFITRHARATMDIDYPMQSKQNTGLSIYLRHLANGQAIAMDTSDPNTQAALARGEALSVVKLGQLNFACIDCHDFGAKRWIRGQYLSGVEGMIAHFPTYRTSRTEIWDIRKRLQWCGVAIRANELPPDAPEYGDIELFLNVKNNGKTFSVPGIRH
ncbi:sulfur oxidation c-type cytochrome SoxA [Thioflexithrix psekupsensis]|uniref:L-cysteine S-thiosulfotransferase subunit SoxA n=1 Tax=Thioflexithrix psekupsensis TaxID=1570016 RepID=A0A251X7M1_9GAMM|nr:sulfur oxidation c-type cytochrome SoxA [Thioflexithrix psekupsensis]OUD14058.1 sulfur oxidation c-type cytochrome SoxX [Thioflexithrix psekupsensis]